MGKKVWGHRWKGVSKQHKIALYTLNLRLNSSLREKECGVGLHRGMRVCVCGGGDWVGWITPINKNYTMNFSLLNSFGESPLLKL